MSRRAKKCPASRRRVLWVQPGSQRPGHLGRLRMIANLLEYRQCRRPSRPRLFRVSGQLVRLPEMLERYRLAGQVACRAVLADGFGAVRDRVVEAALAQEDAAEIVQRVPFAVSADFPEYLAGLGIAFRGRVQVTEAEVHIAKVVD